MDGLNSTSEKDTDEQNSLLQGFDLAEVLRNDVDRKTACLHLKNRKRKEVEGDNQDGVVIISRKPFSNEDFTALMSSEETNFKRLVQNDIYGNYEIDLPMAHNALKATFVFPATQKHIDKYRDVPSRMVAETKDLYEKITRPHIEAATQFSMQWIENILDGQAEQDRIFYQDDDFLLAPDLKWDGKRMENLYVSAICKRRGLKSIRDLTSEHLPLLVNIFKIGTNAICEKYKLFPSQLRIFFHYQPSYYHLHVHFVHLLHEAPGSSVGNAHLLADVIENITLIPDYYQKKTLYYTLKMNDPLLKKLEAQVGDT